MASKTTRTAAGKNKGRLSLVLALTGTFLVAEVVGGLLTGSLALLADAGHMLTDVGGLALALVGIRIAERPASPERTYGLYRVEILAALANAVALLAVSGYVIYEAYKRFRDPPAIEAGPMLAVAALGLGVNIVGIVLLRKSAAESLNMRGAYFEVFSDLITSIGVLVGGVIVMTTSWNLVDPILSAGIGLFIVPRTWGLLKEAVGVLLEGTPSDVSIAAVRAAITGFPGVIGTHDLHVWSLTSGKNAMSVHVVVPLGTDPVEIRRSVRAHLLDGFPVQHVTIQVEYPGEEEGEQHV